MLSVILIRPTLNKSLSYLTCIFIVQFIWNRKGLPQCGSCMSRRLKHGLKEWQSLILNVVLLTGRWILTERVQENKNYQLYMYDNHVVWWYILVFSCGTMVIVYLHYMYLRVSSSQLVIRTWFPVPSCPSCGLHTGITPLGMWAATSTRARSFFLLAEL